MEPLGTLGEAEVPILLIQQDDFTPFRAKLPIGASLLIGQELFLTDAVMSAVSCLVEPVALLDH